MMKNINSTITEKSYYVNCNIWEIIHLRHLSFKTPTHHVMNRIGDTMINVYSNIQSNHDPSKK
jgi:hypothetical protein